MQQLIFRGIFIIVIVAVLVGYICSDAISQYTNEDGEIKFLPDEVRRANFNSILWCGLGLAVTVFLIDLFTPKKKLGALSGVFFGLLVGLFLTWCLTQVLDLLNEIHRLGLTEISLSAIKTVMAICVCYLVISIVMRTKDDVRFVIPYVEFAKQTKGARPLVLDTSAIIDGRIADLCQSKLFDAPLMVPRFVLNELQLVADSADKLKRNRGRRGLDILNKMQTNSAIEVEINDTMYAEVEEVKGVDQKLVMFTRACNGRLATTDYNLSKVAQVREVDVVNINDLANSLKVVALPGETMEVKIIKPGEEIDQGIGYLDDGTMVVVEGARNKIGRDLLISITSSLQTSAGKMIFGKFEGFVQDTGSNNRRKPQKKPVTIHSTGNNRNQ